MMADCLTIAIRSTLPGELFQLMTQEIECLQQVNLETLLDHDLAKLLLAHEQNELTKHITTENHAVWNEAVFRRLTLLLKPAADVRTDQRLDAAYRRHFFFFVAIVSLQAFLQSNVTGPPLPFVPSKLLFPYDIRKDPKKIENIRQSMRESLTVDGEAIYRLTPNIELLGLADNILSCPTIKKNVRWARWARLRTDFILQRILAEPSSTLHNSIYDNLDLVKEELSSLELAADDLTAQFRLEAAAIHLHHGDDKKAREDVGEVAKMTRFDFALTGLRGKRTKYQETETSQLLVLAKSSDTGGIGRRGNDPLKQEVSSSLLPRALDLNDDTLLESISFSDRESLANHIRAPSSLPSSLSSLDPSNQPRLNPVDSIVLLSLASSITNTSPADGLTREETLPYALRVLDGGSSNWQIYTQALLIRSRIEGYRSRTAERGLLQLQMLVDQILAETDPGGRDASLNSGIGTSQSTFLPRAKESEAAPASERLQYIHQLGSPTRWELQSELASRWVSLGGLRSALEIYEKLEMWADAALCLAAIDQEDKAKAMIRKQLFHATQGADDNADEERETWGGKEREPVPTDAPRLYCILGDIDQDASMYDKAWELSGRRYARAQRSLGRQAFAANDFEKAAEAYSMALKINRLNGSSWFAFGCALLQLEKFEEAVEAFTRTVQLDDSDAEAWSNLAAALLNNGSSPTPTEPAKCSDQVDSNVNEQPSRGPQQYKSDALKVLKRAASLRYDNSRIWDNILTVAASIVPPAYADIISAQTRIIKLRTSTEGERCIDANVLSHLVRHVVSNYRSPPSVKLDETGDKKGFSNVGTRTSGLPQLLINLMDNHVTPIITKSPALWRTVATLSLWRDKPSAALSAHEKAWRATITGANPGWESGTPEQWNEVVDASVELVGAYESLGPRKKTEDLAAGTGDFVAKDWQFKARSALKGVMGRARESWGLTEGWERLEQALEGLQG